MPRVHVTHLFLSIFDENNTNIRCFRPNEVGAAPGAPPSGGGGGGGAAPPPGPPIGGSATTSTKQPEVKFQFFHVFFSKIFLNFYSMIADKSGKTERSCSRRSNGYG